MKTFFRLLLLALCSLLSALSSFAQTAAPRLTLYSQIDTLFPDVSATQITPADVRTSLKNITASSYNGLTDGSPSTVGLSIFTAANPSAIRFLRINADNTVTFLDAATFLTAIGGGSSTWGAITGTLSAQADLQTALNAKVPTTRTIAGLDLSADRTLDALTGLSSVGLVKRTAANTLGIATAGTDYLTGNQTVTLSGDVTGSGATAITTTLANVPGGTPMMGSLLATNIAAPASPAAGKNSLFSDSTDLRFHDKNASGVIGTTVVADTGAANNFLVAVSAAGVISKAQPAFTNISGSVAANQMPALTGDVTTSAGTVATTLANTTVTPGSYTGTNLTVDSKGRITAASNGGTALSAITAATAGNTIANGNNTGQVWNWANTTDSTAAMTLGETTAATGGTSTSGVPNQVGLKLATLAGSTQSPLSVYSRGSHVFSVSPSTIQILAGSSGAFATPTYSFSGNTGVGLLNAGGSLFVLADYIQGRTTGGIGRIFYGDGITFQVPQTGATSSSPGFTDLSNSNTGLNWFGSNMMAVVNITDGEWVRWISFAQQNSRGSAGTTAYALNFRKARGTVAAPTVITTGDDLATISGYGYVGATNTYKEATRITSSSTGTIADSTSGIGGTLKFYSTLAGTDTAPQLGMTLAGGSVPKLTLAASGTIDLANADTTLSRASAGTMAVAGVNVLTTATGVVLPTWGTLSGVSPALTFAATKQNLTFTLSGNTTFTASGYAQGADINLYITCDSTTRTLSFPAWTWINGTPASVTASKHMVIHLRCTGTTAGSVYATYGSEL